MACDWVEKGSEILVAITSDENADGATHKAAQAIGRAQSKLLNMQGMFSRALNQIERQRVHLGQSGLSTTDIKRWLLQHEDLAVLAEGAIDQPVVPLFSTPAEMIDVAETELLSERAAGVAQTGLPSGEDAPTTISDGPAMQLELDDFVGPPVELCQPGQLPQHSRGRAKERAGARFAAAGQLCRGVVPRLDAAAPGRCVRSEPAGRDGRTGPAADHLYADRRDGPIERPACGGHVDRLAVPEYFP